MGVNGFTDIYWLPAAADLSAGEGLRDQTRGPLSQVGENYTRLVLTTQASTSLRRLFFDFTSAKLDSGAI